LLNDLFLVDDTLSRGLGAEALDEGHIRRHVQVVGIHTYTHIPYFSDAIAHFSSHRFSGVGYGDDIAECRNDDQRCRTLTPGYARVDDDDDVIIVCPRPKAHAASKYRWQVPKAACGNA